jgi:hypothetical protein
LYTYVGNNPLTRFDPTGHWCESANNKWAHSGSCSDATSTYSDDMVHDNGQMKFNGYEPSGAIFHYSIDDCYLRWKLGNQNAFTSASDDNQNKLLHMAMSDWTWADAGYWAASGALLGLSVIEPFLLVADGGIVANEEMQANSQTRVIGSYYGVEGKYPSYVTYAETEGLKYFQIPKKIWDGMSKVEQLAANQKFLDKAAAKGANFILTTPIEKINPGTALAWEVDSLMSLGYKFGKASDGSQFFYIPK